jgi:hypothetical protein
MRKIYVVSGRSALTTDPLPIASASRFGTNHYPLYNVLTTITATSVIRVANERLLST